MPLLAWPFCLAFSKQNALRAAGVLILAFLFLPKAAFAHSSVPGIEGFYSGFLHPFKETAQGLAIAALGLFVGQQPTQHADKVAVVFILALIAGAIAAFVRRGLIAPDPLFFLVAMIIGILVAISRPVGPVIMVFLAAATGTASGVISMPDPGSWSAMAFTLSGSFFGAVLLFLYAFGGARWVMARAERPWLSIGVRVLGSWIAAACALMLALAMRA